MKKLTAVLLTLGLGTALYACPAGGDRFKGGPDKGRMHKIMKQLDLSSEQKEQLQSLREARKEMMQAKRKSCKADKEKRRAQMRPDLSKFMTANSFDKEAFKQEMKKKYEARRAQKEKRKAAMLESRADHMEKMFNILTPEQRIKWIELSKQQ